MTNPAKKCKASALHSKNCYCNSCWSTTTARAVSYSAKNAKPALCTPRIAIAILVGVPLLHEQFPIPQKMQSQRFALQELLLQFLLVYHYCTSSFLFRKKCKASALHSKNCYCNSCWCTTTARTISYSIKKGLYSPFSHYPL